MSEQKLKVGDKVEVVCSVEAYDPDGMGQGVQWGNEWICGTDLGDMDTRIRDGNVYTIGQMLPCNAGVLLKEDKYEYGWPLKALRLVHVEEGVAA